MNLAVATAQAGLDAAMTIGARMPVLMTAGVDPTGAKAAETARMVGEKFSAAAHGTFAAQFAWGRFMLRASLGGVRTPADWADGMVDVFDAATKPARKTVRANARRLTGT